MNVASTAGERLLSLKEYADLWRVDPRTVRRWIKAKRIDAEKHGLHGQWRIRVTQVSTFVNLTPS